MTYEIVAALLPELLQSAGLREPTTAVVIDTLRFTTTACQALLAGASSIMVAATVEEAQHLAASRTPRPLLCGERECHPIGGFDLGNSPYEYSPQAVKNRRLIFTTTNGTRAVAAVQSASQVLLAGLVNRRAVCRRLRQQTVGRLAIVCAGTDGEIAWEDVLTAGALVDELTSDHESVNVRFACGNDSARLALAAWHELSTQSGSVTPERIQSMIGRGRGGENLLKAGYGRDVGFAAQLDSLDIVPQSTDNDCRLFV